MAKVGPSGLKLSRKSKYAAVTVVIALVIVYTMESLFPSIAVIVYRRT